MLYGIGQQLEVRSSTRRVNNDVKPNRTKVRGKAANGADHGPSGPVTAICTMQYSTVHLAYGTAQRVYHDHLRRREDAPRLLLIA